jgi:hypothetical protein
MLYDHLAAHNAWQVVETSFLNFYFGGGQGADAGPQPAAESMARETELKVVSITTGEQEASSLSVSLTADSTRDGGTGGWSSPVLHRHRWVLPLNYWCVAETAARYDDLTLCSTFDFSSCGRSRFKVRACVCCALGAPAWTQRCCVLPVGEPDYRSSGGRGWADLFLLARGPCSCLLPD